MYIKVERHRMLGLEFQVVGSALILTMLSIHRERTLQRQPHLSSRRMRNFLMSTSSVEVVDGVGNHGCSKASENTCSKSTFQAFFLTVSQSSEGNVNCLDGRGIMNTGGEALNIPLCPQKSTIPSKFRCNSSKLPSCGSPTC